MTILYQTTIFLCSLRGHGYSNVSCSSYSRGNDFIYAEYQALVRPKHFLIWFYSKSFN